MAISTIFMIPLRIAQAVCTIIILGLMAYVVSNWSGAWTWAPSQANFLLFCSIWTILALLYLHITPNRYPPAAHKFGILAAEFLTMIFWFGGFIAFSVLLSDWGCDEHWGVCRASEAAAVFAAFEWLMFAFTTLLSALHCWRTRGTGETKHNPEVAATAV